MISMRRTKGLLAAGCFVITCGLLFQNCAPQFKSASSLDGDTSQTGQSVPSIQITSSMPDLTNASSLKVDFQISPNASSMASVKCQLNNAAPVDCLGGTVTFSNLIDGDYTLMITAVTSGGLSVTAQKLFRKDATPPTVTVSQTPAAVNGSTSANFVFTANDALSGVQSTQCALDANAFADCVSPINLSALAVGAHKYQIKSLDKANNLSSIYSYSWTIDLTAPTLTLNSKPKAYTNVLSANFTFSSSDAIKTFECQLDSGNYTTCASPQAYSGLTAAAHTFRVRGYDAAGNVSSPVSYTWMIDTAPPAKPTLTSSVPASTTLKNATFNFASSDADSGVAGFTCSLDGATYSSCSSPKTFTALSDGAHVMKVMAQDNAGNASPEAVFNWAVTAATTNLTLGWDPNTETTLAGYKIYYGTSSGNYTSSIDVGALAPVNGVVSYVVPNLVAGSTYYFAVVAYDSSKVESTKSNEVIQLAQ